jgi:antitoxin PrlF
VIDSKADLPYILAMGIELKITAKGQITLKKEVLDHLKARPGDMVKVDTAEDGHVSIHRITNTHSIKDLVGILKRPAGVKPVTLKDFDEAIASGWAGEVKILDDPA